MGKKTDFLFRFQLFLVIIFSILLFKTFYADELVSQEQTDSNLSEISEKALTPEILWAKVLEANKFWLDPKPEHLAYTMLMVNPSLGQNECIHRVWIEGEKARWEMEEKVNLFGDPLANYTVVITPEGEMYLRAPKESMLNRISIPRSTRNLCQGVSLHTAMHELAQNGVSPNSKIVEIRKIDSHKIVILETDLGKAKVSFGLGLYNLWFGHASMPIGLVRIHFQLPEYQPILEEFVGTGRKVEYSPDFFMFGGQQIAPQFIRLYWGKFFEKDLVIEMRFQRFDKVWILKEGLNFQGGELVRKIVTRDIDTAPQDPKLFDYSAYLNENTLYRNVKNEELFKAVEDGKIDAVQVALEKGADINAKSDNSWTALMWASFYDYLDIAKLLIEKGADVNIKGDNDLTALMLASMGHIDIVELLIKNGADVNAVDNDGNTSLKIASQNENTDIVELLKRSGARE